MATVYVELPQGYNVAGAAITMLRLCVDGKRIAVQASPATVGDHDGDGVPDLMVKLDGQQIGAALNGYSGEIEISVIGYLLDGSAFLGGDTAKVRP